MEAGLPHRRQAVSVIFPSGRDAEHWPESAIRRGGAGGMGAAVPTGCGVFRTWTEEGQSLRMFSAILIEKGEAGQSAAVKSLDEADLPAGNVTVDVEYSTVNYKDGLAITARSPVVRAFPMVPGIDFAGVVTESTHPAWKAGDRVVLNGWGVGERHWGGLAQRARGVDFRRQRWDRKIKGLLAMVIPLFLSVLRRSGELAQAMEARGFVPGALRTSHAELGWERGDTLTAGLSFLFLLAGIIWRWLAG